MELVPLHADFGAEVRGIGLIDVVSRDGAYRRVREAFEAHSVLVWRDQPVDDTLQATFCRAFGPLELTKPGALGEGTVFVRLNNIAEDGSPVPPNHRQALAARANALWHTDSSFKQTPALASMLTARAIPGEGGETEFVSTRAAWARLPRAVQSRLSSLVAEHSFLTSRSRIDPDFVTQAERAALPPVRWRLCWPNPVNYQAALYVASHAGAVVGMGDEEARTLLDQLIEDATASPHVYRHVWRPGDAVLWDNRATMHRGRPFPGERLRSMVRTTISATEHDGLAGVRPAA